MFAGCYFFAFPPWCDSGHTPGPTYRLLHDSLQHFWTGNELPRSFHGAFTSIPPHASTYSPFLSPFLVSHFIATSYSFTTFPSLILCGILFPPLCSFFQGSGVLWGGWGWGSYPCFVFWFILSGLYLCSSLFLAQLFEARTSFWHRATFERPKKSENKRVVEVQLNNLKKFTSSQEWMCSVKWARIVRSSRHSVIIPSFYWLSKMVSQPRSSSLPLKRT